MMSKPINKSGKRKVVKVGRDGRKRAYWVGTSQKGGRLRNEGAPGEKQSFMQKHGKKIAAGVAGAAAIGLGLAARHHLKSEAGQRHLHNAAHAVGAFQAKHNDSILYRAAKGAVGSLRGHKSVTAAGVGHEISRAADAVRGQQHTHPSHHSTPTHRADPVHREKHDTYAFEGNGRRVGGSQWGAR